METTVYCNISFGSYYNDYDDFFTSIILKKEAINSYDYQDDDNVYRHTITSLVEICDGIVLYNVQCKYLVPGFSVPDRHQAIISPAYHMKSAY